MPIFRIRFCRVRRGLRKNRAKYLKPKDEARKLVKEKIEIFNKIYGLTNENIKIVEK